MRPEHEPRPAPPVATGLRRRLLQALAVASLGLAVLGVILPGLPATEFVLLAGWAAMRSSPRLYAWLCAHPLFGPMLVNWDNGRRISRRAKWAITLSMGACLLLMWRAVPRAIPYPEIVLFTALVLACVLAWIWRRPEPATVRPVAPPSSRSGAD